MQRPTSIGQSQSHSYRNPNNHNHGNTSSSSSSQPTNPSNWLVNDESLRDVPSFYPLEKSSKYIHDKASTIANRISDCCRVMSVQAHFDNDLVRKS